MEFRHLPDIFYFNKTLCLKSFSKSSGNVYIAYIYISNDGALFYLWWKEKLLKCQKLSKYYANGGLQVFLLVFMSLLTTRVVKNSHIKARIYFIFKKTC